MGLLPLLASPGPMCSGTARSLGCTKAMRPTMRDCLWFICGAWGIVLCIWFTTLKWEG